MPFTLVWKATSDFKPSRSRDDFFSDRVEASKHVLVRLLDNESVFPNLETEDDYSLDEIGTRMWQAVTAAPYIDAYEQLLSQFDLGAQHFVRISRSSSSAR